MIAAPAIDGYDWPGGRETMLRFGPAGAPAVIVAPPLFEEANRTRALIVATLRALAARGIGGLLPDLPGQGESERDLAGLRLSTWHEAFAAAVARGHNLVGIVALRGGALVAAGADERPHLHIAPIAGKALVRDLLRARRAAAMAQGERLAADDIERDGPPLLLAGNRVDRPLLRDLMVATPADADWTVTLFPDPAAADRVLAPPKAPGPGADAPRFRAPWSAAEPFADASLAAVLAEAIAEWIASCAG